MAPNFCSSELGFFLRKHFACEKIRRRFNGGFEFLNMNRFLLYVLLYSLIACALRGNTFAADRIVSVAPSNTEIIVELGLGDKLVGVSDQCRIPLFLHPERVGGFSAVNKEKIISLKPDLVLTSDGVQEPIARDLRKLGLPVVVIRVRSITDILKSIVQIGELVDEKNKASLLIDKLQRTLLGIERDVTRIPKDQRPTVFVEMWNQPMTTAGNLTFIDEIIRSAGGINIAGNLNDAYPRINPEWVIRENPDIIIIGYLFDGYRGRWKNAVEKRPGWKDISAVKHNRIHDEISPEMILQPGPHVVQGVQNLHAIITQVINERHTP
jgi:iron complex transport system substrate-binding protein